MVGHYAILRCFDGSCDQDLDSLATCKRGVCSLLERDIAELLIRSVGRPGHKSVVWYKSFLYQAASWKTPWRVVAKVEFHFGELFPRVEFILTHLKADSRR